MIKARRNPGLFFAQEARSPFAFFPRLPPRINDKMCLSRGGSMRLLLIALVMLAQMSQARATCQVFVPVKYFSNSGYGITFDFTKMFHDKNYTEVYSPDVADLQLNIEGTEQEGSAGPEQGTSQAPGHLRRHPPHEGPPGRPLYLRY